MVLLMGLSDTRAQDLCREGVESRLSMFHTLEKWSLSLRPGFRMVWVMCWGIPLHVWDVANITKIVEGIGEVVDVDEDVDVLQRLDRAQVLIKTPWPPTINYTITMSINGADYVVSIVEELCHNYRRYNCNRGSYVESFEEISSAGSEIELDLMSEEAQVNDEFLVTNMEMGADRDDIDRNIGLQQLPVGYCTNSVTTVNQDTWVSYLPKCVSTHSGLGEEKSEQMADTSGAFGGSQTLVQEGQHGDVDREDKQKQGQTAEDEAIEVVGTAGSNEE
ncbi:hypothetical protein AAZX31_15G158300 [Glycine max]